MTLPPFIRRTSPLLGLAVVALLIAALLFLTGCATWEEGQNVVVDPRAFGFRVLF
jgi:di/tricarboxylate transporter